MLLVNTIKMVHVTVDCYVNLPEGIFLSAWVFACFEKITLQKTPRLRCSPWNFGVGEHQHPKSNVVLLKHISPCKKCVKLFSANAWCLIDEYIHKTKYFDVISRITQMMRTKTTNHRHCEFCEFHLSQWLVVGHLLATPSSAPSRNPIPTAHHSNTPRV